MFTRPAVLAVAAALFTTSAALACPFCSVQGQTLIGEVAQADFILFGTLTNAKPAGGGLGGGTTDLAVEAVIKPHDYVKDKKVVIGVVNHHSLQVERPDEIAALIREALKYIPAERLIISSDCGMGREGMGRRHAAYKMVSMVLGTNIVRKELGLPEAECLAADPRYSLTETKR